MEPHSNRYRNLYERFYRSISVNGGWSSWSTWSACSKTCDTGQKRRNRTCTNPAPAGFGRDCSGNSDEISICNEKPCSGMFGLFPPSNNVIFKVFFLYCNETNTTHNG